MWSETCTKISRRSELEMLVAPEFVTKMIERGLLGNKPAGLLAKKAGDKREIWTDRHAGLSTGAKGETAIARHGQEH